MRTSAIVKYLGFVLLFNALFMFIAAAISLFLKENSFTPLFYSAVVCTILGFFPLVFIEKIEEISFHEGMIISVFGWLTTCLVGVIPYFMWGGEFTLANAIFESVSGYTTTGATILQNVEALTKGMLFWRASTHFIGGVGVVLFVLLILPNAKGARSSIYKSEISGLSRLNFQTRTREIAKIIGTVYLSLTLVEIIILWALGMTFFDAVCHAFSTLSTGGFSTKNLSVAHFNNVWIEITITLFMLLGSLHFGLMYATVSGKKLNIFSSKVVRMYLLIIVIGTISVAYKLTHDHVYDWAQALRHASFQIVSLVSTTGFATADTSVWPIFTIVVLIYFSMQCGMVGSTAGGIKFDRIYLFFHTFVRQIRQTQHPSAVYISKMDGTPISSDTEERSMAYIVIYIFVLLITTLILSSLNIDGMTSFSAAVASLGNVGPGFGEIGSLDNFSFMPNSAKIILSIVMLLGRLEVMNILALAFMLRKI